MAPGLTSPGGKMQDLPADTIGFAILYFIFIVAIYGEGKEHALAIGITKMSTE